MLHGYLGIVFLNYYRSSIESTYDYINIFLSHVYVLVTEVYT